jgi:hypothetical protein
MDDPALDEPRKAAPSANPEKDQHDPTLERLHTSSLPQLLDMDSRPTFVLDTESYVKGRGLPIRPMFCNAALRKQEQLLNKINGTATENL